MGAEERAALRATNQAGEVTTPLPCPFCGENLMCDPNEGAPFWVHRNRLKSECWLADSWVKDEMDGEGGIREWNTRAALATQPATSQEGEALAARLRNRTEENPMMAVRDRALMLEASAALAATPTPPTLIPVPRTAKELTAIIRTWLDADCDWGAWEKRLDRLIGSQDQ